MSDWEDFEDDVEVFSVRPTPRCGVGLLLEALELRDREGVLTAMARPEIPHSAISKAFNKRGHKISDFTVGRHRRGACTCEKIG
jgi:hypothetical protein